MRIRRPKYVYPIKQANISRIPRPSGGIGGQALNKYFYAVGESKNIFGTAGKLFCRLRKYFERRPLGIRSAV